MKNNYFFFKIKIIILFGLIFNFAWGQLPTFNLSTSSILIENNGDSRLDENDVLQTNRITSLLTKYASPYQNFFSITNSQSRLDRVNPSNPSEYLVYGGYGGKWTTHPNSAYRTYDGVRACNLGAGDTVVNVRNVTSIGAIDTSNTGIGYTSQNYFYFGIKINSISPDIYVNKVSFSSYTTYNILGDNSLKVGLSTYYRIAIVEVTDNASETPVAFTWVTNSTLLSNCTAAVIPFTGTYANPGFRMISGKRYQVRFYVSRSNNPYTLNSFFNDGSNKSFTDNDNLSSGEPSLNPSNINTNIYYDIFSNPVETKFSSLVRRTDNPMVYGNIGPPSIPDLEVNCGTTSIPTSNVINSNLYAPIPTTVYNLQGGTFGLGNAGATKNPKDSQIALRIYNASGTDVTNNATLGLGTYYAAYIYDDDSSQTGTNFTAKKMASVTYSTFNIVQKTTTWNGTAWSNGTPTLNTNVILNGNYDTSINGNLDACNLTVNSGAKLDIKQNNYVRVSNNIINNNSSAANDYNFIVQNDGNLYQINDSGTFTGNLTLYRNSAPIIRTNYVYWGSPVNNQNLLQFSPNTVTSKFFTYNESNDLFDWIDPSINSFTRAQGYAIRAPNNWYTTVKTAYPGKFQGNPYTGAFTFPVKKSTNVIAANGANIEMGNNLISNPYPSNLDLNAFFTLNSSKIYETAYFWTNTNYNPPMQGVNYPSNLPTKPVINNYAVYNKSGGVNAPFGWSGGTGTTTPVTLATPPNNIVKPGQGFVVKVKGTAPISTTITFNNSLRPYNNSTNVGTQFYSRTSSKKKSESVDRYWLTLKNPIDFVTPILIAYKEEATNDYEFDYDSDILVDAGDNFYSIITDHILTIQGRKGPFNENDTVVLGTVNGMEGSHTISLSEKEGVFAEGQPIYLIDKLLNTKVNLQEQSYIFDSSVGTFNDRFEIAYTNTTLSTNDVNKTKVFELYPNPAKDILNIGLDDSIKDFTFEITDTSGRLISSYKNQKKINISKLKSGIYMGTLISGKERISKKFIVK